MASTPPRASHSLTGDHLSLGGSMENWVQRKSRTWGRTCVPTLIIASYLSNKETFLLRNGCCKKMDSGARAGVDRVVPARVSVSVKMPFLTESSATMPNRCRETAVAASLRWHCAVRISLSTLPAENAVTGRRRGLSVVKPISSGANNDVTPTFSSFLLFRLLTHTSRGRFRYFTVFSPVSEVFVPWYFTGVRACRQRKTITHFFPRLGHFCVFFFWSTTFTNFYVGVYLCFYSKFFEDWNFLRPLVGSVLRRFLLFLLVCTSGFSRALPPPRRRRKSVTPFCMIHQMMIITVNNNIIISSGVTFSSFSSSSAAAAMSILELV